MRPITSGKPRPAVHDVQRYTTGTTSHDDVAMADAAPPATSVLMIKGQRRPLGLVLVAPEPASAPQDEFLQETAERLLNAGIDYAVIYPGDELDLGKIEDHFHETINPWTALVTVPSGSIVTIAQWECLTQLVQVFARLTQGMAAPAHAALGSLLNPRVVHAQDPQAAHHMDQTLADCQANQAALRASHDAHYPQRLAAWAATVDADLAAKVTNAITDCQRQGSTVLALDGLGLRNVPPLPDGLTHLSLQDNEIEFLPNNLPDTLICLNACGNCIGKFPAVLPPRLEELHLTTNAIVRLAGFEHPCLRELYLSDNRLRTVDGELPASLRVLNLGSNQLMALHLAAPLALERLILNNNWLSRAPAWLAQLSQGCYMDLNDNPFTRTASTAKQGSHS